MTKLSDIFKLVDGLGQISREEFTRLWMHHSGDEYYLKESAWPRFNQDRLGFVRYWNDGKKALVNVDNDKVKAVLRFTDQLLILAAEKTNLLLTIDCGP